MTDYGNPDRSRHPLRRFCTSPLQDQSAPARVF